jgi:hypothetical protein
VLDTFGLRYYRENKYSRIFDSDDGHRERDSHHIMEARMVNIYEALSVRVTSVKNLEFTLTCRKVVYHLRASNEGDLQRMVDGLKREIATYEKCSAAERKAMFQSCCDRLQVGRTSGHGGGRFIVYDSAANEFVLNEVTVVSRVMYVLQCIVSPVKMLLHATIPSVNTLREDYSHKTEYLGES